MHTQLQALDAEQQKADQNSLKKQRTPHMHASPLGRSSGAATERHASAEGEQAVKGRSVELSAAAAVAAVDGEQQNNGVRGGESEAKESHPFLSIYAQHRKEAWASSEKGAEGNEEGRAAAAIKNRLHVTDGEGEHCMTDTPMSSSTSTLPVPANTPVLPTGRFCSVTDDSTPPVMSMWQVRCAQHSDTHRASAPEMLLRAHRQQLEAGSSSGSSIRSPSMHAAAHALRTQIDALDALDAQQQKLCSEGAATEIDDAPLSPAPRCKSTSACIGQHSAEIEEEEDGVVVTPQVCVCERERGRGGSGFVP